MPAIVDFPTVVKEALALFGALFDTEPARRHFAASLTGWSVAAHQTVSGINRALALTTDQACLHRCLPEGQWDVTALHDRRLAWLQQAPQTRYSVREVIAIENTLVAHADKLIEDVGWVWDHADARHVLAHADMLSHDVCPSGAHFPSAWRRLKKRAACPAQAFKDHTEWCIALIDAALPRGIPGDCTCASYCTSAKVLTHIQSPQRASGGALKRNRKVVYAGRAQPLQDVARQMPWAAQQPVRVGTRQYR